MSAAWLLTISISAAAVTPVATSSSITVHWGQPGTCAKTCSVPDMYIKHLEPPTRRYAQTYTCDELVAIYGRNCSFFAFNFDGCDCAGCGCEDQPPPKDCDATKTGDGYCDASLNTAECKWDDGDCCMPTCTGWACGLTGWNCLDPGVSGMSGESATVDTDACIATLLANRPSAAWAQVCNAVLGGESAVPYLTQTARPRLCRERVD